MNSTIRSECGRTVIECEYDPDQLDWNQAIEAAYRLHGLRPGQVGVIATPAKYPKYRQEQPQTASMWPSGNENAEGIVRTTPGQIGAESRSVGAGMRHHQTGLFGNGELHCGNFGG